ncbi:hypothetical protein BN1723_018858, partial [Verticillium longisporum]
MEDWSLSARRSREVVWRMYEASRQPSMRSESQSQSPVLHAMGSNEHGSILMAAEAELRMSPIGLEPEGMGMMGMLDQQGLWDLDGMFWGGASGDSSTDAQSHPHHQQQQPGGVDFGGFSVNEQMMHMDYNMIGTPASAVTMDGGFFVH